MMNFLQMLLGQQAAPAAAQEPPVMELQVLGARPEEPNPPPPDVSVANTQAQALARYNATLDNTDFIRSRQEAVRAGEKASDRRGLFGVKGALRDALGLVGDSYLIRQGKSPAYAALRKEEKISDAMAGGEFNPAAARARVGYYDPKMEQDMLKAYEDQQFREEQLESLRDSRQSLVTDREIKQTDKATLQVQGVLAQRGAYNPDGSLTEAAQQAISLIARNSNREPEDLLGDLQGEAAQLFSGARTTPYQQDRLEQYDVGLGQGQQNADSRTTSARASMIRAQRPPAGRSPPQPTEASMLSEFMRIPRAQRTPEQQAFIERKTQPTGSSRGPKKRTVPSSGSSGWKIRPRGQ